MAELKTEIATILEIATSPFIRPPDTPPLPLDRPRLGTLSVLRSNALGTAGTTVEALIGTLARFRLVGRLEDPVAEAARAARVPWWR